MLKTVFFLFLVIIDLFLLVGHNLARSFLQALRYPAELHTNAIITVLLATHGLFAS